MKKIFDVVSENCSRNVTNLYSTSFSMATRLLHSSIRQDIYNIYGFVRFADEIVDTFHDFPKKDLLNRFEKDLYHSIKNKISLNPILNSFQITVNKYNIDSGLIKSFLKSMRWDLEKKVYTSNNDYKEYIYGSADVVGLMCLKIFVKGDSEKYLKLKSSAMSLGSAFQKVNFLRDLNDDYEKLNRTYFPEINVDEFDEESKRHIILEIEKDFKLAHKGIFKLPTEARLGVYTAYKYYGKLLYKLKKTPSLKIKKSRIRVPNYQKMGVLLNSYLKYQFNLI
ncbi:MAG: phytoene synthase [Flavobacteriales bacterium]|nr:phytoene synthase [Flavobacteriales bacterium]|tara:strand:+ start:208 stop:1047 length:840 start_codon:yes stop_codon:yes gene_type:complete